MEEERIPSNKEGGCKSTPNSGGGGDELRGGVRRQMEDEEWEKICRICLNPEKPGQSLRHPCPCRGSIKYGHAKCLLFWLNHSGLDSCEAIAQARIEQNKTSFLSSSIS
ncbi:hypothetical protein YC2023_010227 [Brassica napus]